MSDPTITGDAELSTNFPGSSPDYAREWLPADGVLPDWFVSALEVPREDGFIDVLGARIRTYRWGDRKKPGLLLTHGFLAHARCFAFIAPFLAADYHIVAYDLSGMGESDARDSYPDDLRADEMAGVAEAAGLTENGAKPVIIAHSYGAGVGVGTVTRYPDLFAGLIVCDLMIMRPERMAEHFAAGGGRPGSRDHRKPNKVYPDYATARGRYVLSPPQPVGVPFLMDYMAYHSMRRVDGGYSWKFDPSVLQGDDREQDFWTRQGERMVHAPGRKAIVYGEKSRLFDTDSAAWLRELGGHDLPIIAVPEARHHLMLDQPLAFVTALRAVLESWNVRA